MRTPFVESVLSDLLEDGTLSRSNSVVAVCATTAEQHVLSDAGFADVLLTNLELPPESERRASVAWERQDAQRLDLADGSFDVGFVADGLHHCASPHRALLELYRVSRKAIVVVESRDSALMRLAVRLGLSPEYELEAVVDNGGREGGVDNTSVPNYVYRWTEAELRKTVSAANPIGPHRFRFFHSLELPHERLRLRRGGIRNQVAAASEPLLRVVTRIVPSQCNALAMVALKPRIPDDLWPWLTLDDGEVVFDAGYARARFR